MPNLSGATNFFTKSAENTVAMTLGGSVTGGVTTTIPVNNMSNYTDGDIVAFVVDPASPTTKQVFTGTKSGTNVINAVWTEGTNQAHTAGATVIDYTTATHWDLLLLGLLVSHNINGTLKAGIVNSAAIATGAITNALLSTATGDLGGVWNDYSSTSTIVGWSSFTDKVIRYTQIGKTVYVNFALKGTSNSTTVTFTLPVAAKNISGGTGQFAMDMSTGLNMDNGAIQATPGRIYIDPSVSLNTINVTKASGTTGFTASGTKDVRGMIFYEAA